MKILLFSGSHSRHFFVHRALTELGAEYFAFVMKREDLIPAPPPGLPRGDETNFIRHFEDRARVERAIYGDYRPADIFKPGCFEEIGESELNTAAVAATAKKFGADIAFIFGTNIIREPVFSSLPRLKVNLHLGLSPWYRGSATLFWPFYFLQPQFAGITLHQISDKADAGEIIHQSVPSLQKGEGIHDVSAHAVVKARQDVLAMMKIFAAKGDLPRVVQTTTGRVWRNKDFRPCHLRLIYDTFQNRMVDEYLDGHLGTESPKLITL